MLVSATNTRTKMRYPFATVRSEEVKVSGTRPLFKILKMRMSWKLVSVGNLRQGSESGSRSSKPKRAVSEVFDFINSGLGTQRPLQLTFVLTLA